MVKIAEPIQYPEVDFSLTSDQVCRLNTWIREVHLRAAEKQLASSFAEKVNKYGLSVPNYGAIGGGYSFSFTGTGLGTVCTVTESITGEVLDLSNYEGW